MLRSVATACQQSMACIAPACFTSRTLLRSCVCAETSLRTPQCHYSPAPATPDPDVNPEPSPNVLKLLDMLENLSVKEFVWFNKLLQERLGISDADLGFGARMAAPAAAAPAAAEAAAPEPPPKEEKTTFDVIIEGFDASAKIKIIKEVRTMVPGLGLKEGKALVEKLPATIKSGISKAEAEEVEKKLNAVGATVKIT